MTVRASTQRGRVGPRADNTSGPASSTMATKSTAPSVPALLIRPYAPSPAATVSGSGSARSKRCASASAARGADGTIK
jgi:hypothetical protein